MLTASFAPSAATTPPPDERQIRNQPFCWQSFGALQRIQREYDGQRRTTALALYTTLTLIASSQRTPDRCQAACAYLGALIGAGEVTARRYLHEFAALGLLRIEQRNHAASTYVLLEVTSGSVVASGDGDDTTPAPKPLRSGSRKYAESVGRGIVGDSPYSAVSSATPDRGIAGDSPVVGDTPATAALVADGGITADRAGANRGIVGDRAVGQRGISGDPQNTTSDSNKRTEQANNQAGVGVGMAVNALGKAQLISDNAGYQPQAAVIQIPQQAASIQIPQTVVEPDGEQLAAIHLLVKLGMRRTVAAAVAASYPAADIAGWVRYAQATPGLNNPAGFVLARLKGGDTAPIEQPRHPSLQVDWAALRDDYYARIGGPPPLPREEDLPPLRYGVEGGDLRLATWHGIGHRFASLHRVGHTGASLCGGLRFWQVGWAGRW